MFPSFKHLLCATAFACAVVAQNINIAQPTAGTALKAGSTLVVRLDEPASSGSKDVSVVIGISPCATGCTEISQSMGSVLYSGPFDPKSSDGSGGVYQDISVTVPSYFNGPVQLNVARFYLSGSGSSPEMQLATTSITLFGASG